MKWVLLLALGGCSAVLVNRPPRCTETYVPAVIDTVIAAAALGMVAVVASADLRRDDGDAEAAQTAIGIPAGVSMMVYGISAVHGYTVVGACRARRR